jgi:hypothetical protein
MRRARHLTAALLLACALPASAQDNAPDQQAEGEQAVQTPAPLVMRELLVVQADRYDDTANNPKLQGTALPAKVNKTGRDKLVDETQQYKDQAMPLGVLTFQGEFKEPLDVKIKLKDSSSRFQAYFPDEDAIIGSKHLEWKTVRPANDKQRPVPFGDQGDWLTSLRGSEDRAWLQSRHPQIKERFLLYDASFKFKPAIDLSFLDAQYKLKTSAPEQAAPPLCILVRKQDNGWSADTLNAPWPQPTPVIAQKKSDTTALPKLAEALAPIKELLEQRGYNKQEVGLAVDMVAAAGSEKSGMSLVYILPVGVIDEHIELDISPKPDQIIRTAIIVVNNVDPGMGSQIKALIADLGSDQWIKRDRAQRELIELRQAAIKQVQPLKNSKDPEIAFRARQILDAYDWKINRGR